MKSKIAFTALWTLPTIILGSITIVFTLLDARERQTEFEKAQADKCAREYANAVAWQMHLDGKIDGKKSFDTEWQFAYMTHLLEKH